MSTFDTIESLLEDQLKDLYSAESQLIKALPKMAKKASDSKLVEAINSHLEETQGQVERLEQIGKLMEIKLTGKKCMAMEGLLEEGKEAMDADGDERLVDVALIAAAQRVEHYEISAYGTAATLAEKIGLSEVAELLRETEAEESAADEKLSVICEDEILANFESSSEEDEEEEEDIEETSSRPSAGRKSSNSRGGMSAKSRR